MCFLKVFPKKIEMKNWYLVLLSIAPLIISNNIIAQENHPDSTFHPREWHEKMGEIAPEEPHYVDNGHLETEIEAYPFNVVVPNDPVVKNEVMINFHRFIKDHKYLINSRFFLDANMHWKGHRDLKDLIMYTEFVFGYELIQLGAEIGTVTGSEYISVGPQLTAVNNKIFKRVALVTRIFPDRVLGYEYTTKEMKFIKGSLLSSSGTSRFVLHSKQKVYQASLWLSFEKWKGVYMGFEYEHNNANIFNNIVFERPNELFFGVKFELH